MIRWYNMSDADQVPDSAATLQDYEAVAPNFQIVEFIHGDIIVTPPPNIKHQQYHRELFLALGNALKESGLGELFSAPIGVKTPTGQVVEADIVVILNERHSFITENYIEGPPHLVVEILSPSTQHRDWGIKRVLYGELGVDEYWVVNPDTGQVTVHELGDDGKLEVTTKVRLNDGETLKTSQIPDFEFKHPVL